MMMIRNMISFLGSDCMNGLLQFFQESGSVRAVHLGMMELEGDGERHLQQAFAVTAP
jgi:hypothetical protein